MMGMFRFKGCDSEWEGQKSYEEIISIPKHLLDEEIDHMAMIGVDAEHMKRSLASVVRRMLRL